MLKRDFTLHSKRSKFYTVRGSSAINRSANVVSNTPDAGVTGQLSAPTAPHPTVISQILLDSCSVLICTSRLTTTDYLFIRSISEAPTTSLEAYSDSVAAATSNHCPTPTPIPAGMECGGKDEDADSDFRHPSNQTHQTWLSSLQFLSSEVGTLTPIMN